MENKGSEAHARKLPTITKKTLMKNQTKLTPSQGYQCSMIGKEELSQLMVRKSRQLFAAASSHSGIRVASNRWTQEDMLRGRDFCLIRQDVQERSWVVTSLGVVVVVTVLCMQHFCHPISHPTPSHRPARQEDRERLLVVLGNTSSF